MLLQWEWLNAGELPWHEGWSTHGQSCNASSTPFRPQLAHPRLADAKRVEKRVFVQLAAANSKPAEALASPRTTDLLASFYLQRYPIRVKVQAG